MFGFDIFAIVFVALGIILVAKGVKSVPQGEVWTIERFGKYTCSLSPGLHIIIPFIDDIGHKQIVMEQVLDVPPQEVISSDNAMVTTDAVCFYQIVDPVKAAYEVNDLDDAHTRLTVAGVQVSEVRKGRKAGTRVMSVKSHDLGIPTLLLDNKGER